VLWRRQSVGWGREWCSSRPSCSRRASRTRSPFDNTFLVAWFGLVDHKAGFWVWILLVALAAV
jgi:hypothetical protein